MVQKVSDVHIGVTPPGAKKESRSMENSIAPTGNPHHSASSGMSSRPQNGISGAIIIPASSSP